MALKWVLYGQGKEVVWSLKIYNISDFITFYKGLTMLSLVHCFTFKWNVDTTGEVKERYWEWLGFDSSLKEGFLSLTVTAYVVSLKRGCLYTRKMRLPLVRCGWRKGRQEGGPGLLLGLERACLVPSPVSRGRQTPAPRGPQESGPGPSPKPLWGPGAWGLGKGSW